MPSPHLLFVTGKLAEPSLRRLLAELAPKVGFDYSVTVLPITVAALATTRWVANHLTPLPGIDRVLLPGLCLGELGPVMERVGVPVERGPKDLRDLPDAFGERRGPPPGYGAYDIAILAEINHVQRLTPAEILAQARQYREAG